jgi:hypothetical protein
VIDRKLLPSAVEGGGRVRPGGKLTLYTELCGGEKPQQFAAYFDPGNEELAGDATIEQWRSRGILGAVVGVTDRSVAIVVPMYNSVVLGTGGGKVRFVLWDDHARRLSSVVELPAESWQVPQRTHCDVMPVCDPGYQPPIEGLQLSMFSGIASGLGPRRSADVDSLEVPVALRASYVTESRWALSLRAVQQFEGSFGALTTTRAQAELGASIPVGHGLVEAYLGLGGAWVRRFENEAQLAAPFGLTSAIPLAEKRTFMLGAGVEGVWVLPESELAATGFLGVTFTP